MNHKPTEGAIYLLEILLLNVRLHREEKIDSFVVHEKRDEIQTYGLP